MEAVIAIGFLTILTSLLGIVLAIANSKLKVFEDPRIDVVQDMLPGHIVTQLPVIPAAGCVVRSGRAPGTTRRLP